MKQNNSAIMQMLMGNKGNIDSLSFSEEYRDSLSIAVKKLEVFQEKIKDAPELLKAFGEYVEAIENENAQYAHETYREGFAFGLAIGQEVFSK